ncbi:MAG: hypothetical protein IH945_09450 [Armatimonadetes bacterium]|nr:hypothetical protein [Armatimonadota bacterium]
MFVDMGVNSSFIVCGECPDDAAIDNAMAFQKALNAELDPLGLAGDCLSLHVVYGRDVRGSGVFYSWTAMSALKNVGPHTVMAAINSVDRESLRGIGNPVVFIDQGSESYRVIAGDLDQTLQVS